MQTHIKTTTVGWAVAGIIAGVGASAITMNAWSVGAAPGDTDSTFVPIEPCRLFDTRTGEFNVGDRDTPIGEGETHPFQVTGTNGDCTLPADATAVAVNLTGVGPTADTFLTIFPSGVDLPNVSAVNMTAGQPPTPNKLDVQLSAGGSVDVYNAFGTVDVIGDVLGYYTDSTLDEIAERLTALEAADDALTARVATLEALDAGTRLDALESAARPIIATSGGVAATATSGTVESMRSVTIDAPGPGTVAVVASAELEEVQDAEFVRCSVDTAVAEPAAANSYDWQSASDGVTDNDVITITRAFEVGAGPTTFHLVCKTFGVTTAVQSPNVVAVYVPTG